MKAKAYLQEIKRLDKKIENKQMEIASLYDLIQSVTVPVKEVNVQSNGEQDKLGSGVSRIVDLQNEINADIDRYIDRKLEAIRLINRLENDDYINILVRRYVNYEEWQTIADNLHYTRQWIDKLHGRALLEFQKLIEN